VGCRAIEEEEFSIPQLFVVPTTHPTLTMARDGTHNFAARKGGTKQYVATTMRMLYVNP
jgi:hypothetical protein